MFFYGEYPGLSWCYNSSTEKNNTRDKTGFGGCVKELSWEMLRPAIADIGSLDDEKKVTFASFQKRAQSAVQELVYTEMPNPVMLLLASPDTDAEQCVRDLLTKCAGRKHQIYDIVYAENLADELSPMWLHIKSGTTQEFFSLVQDLVKKAKFKLDQEEILLKILKKQDNDPKLEEYLTDLCNYIMQDRIKADQVILNLMVQHLPDRPPLLFGHDLTWKNLFGCVNYLTENGTTYSSHELLEPGLLRSADGGYLVLRISELVHSPALWFKLRHILESGLAGWENPNESVSSIIPFFAPEPTPVNVKLILTGSYIDVASLYSIDPECGTAFYLRADLMNCFPLKDNTHDLALYLRDRCRLMGLLPPDASAVTVLIERACRLAENQTKFALSEQELCNIMREASGRGLRKELQAFTAAEVRETLDARMFRANTALEESGDMFRDKQIILKTRGEVVGQINGLSVISTFGDDFEYGEPTRITATIHSGPEGGISDVEHKADLAGEIHTKAMMIINGYLTHKFGNDYQLPVSANLVFEQSYNEIDGDSASLTGLCAILSALSEKPIKQQFALTGSLDQLGNVQPVGGINEKIEGFFRVCKIQGLTGEQGVIIPESNVTSLVLDEEVVNAVREGKFHIYPVSIIDEAVEILTGVRALLKEEGVRNRDDGKDGKSAKTLDAAEEENIYDIISDKLYEIDARDNPVSLWDRIGQFFQRGD